VPSDEQEKEPAAEKSTAGSVTLTITAEERQILLKGCQAYRRGIPIYLQSAAAERRLVEDLIRRLSE